MTTTEQRLVNLTQRVDQLEETAKTFGKVTNITLMCMFLLTIVVLIKARNV